MKEERGRARAPGVLFFSQLLICIHTHTHIYIYIYIIIIIIIIIIKREAQAPRLYFSVNCLLQSYCYITCCITAAFDRAGASTLRLFIFFNFRQLLIFPAVTRHYSALLISCCIRVRCVSCCVYVFLALLVSCCSLLISCVTYFLLQFYVFLALLISCCSLLISCITYFLSQLRALQWRTRCSGGYADAKLVLGLHYLLLMTCGLTCCIHYIP